MYRRMMMMEKIKVLSHDKLSNQVRIDALKRRQHQNKVSMLDALELLEKQAEILVEHEHRISSQEQQISSLELQIDALMNEVRRLHIELDEK